MSEDLINCGQRRVQKLHRVAIRDICKNHDIEQGELVEVYIKKVKISA